MVSEYTTNCFFVSGSRVDLSEWIQVFEHLGFNSYKRTVWDPNSLKIDGKSYFRGRGWRLDRIQIQGRKAGLLLNPAYPTFDKLDGHPLAYTPAGLSNPANYKPTTWKEIKDIKDKLMEVSGKVLTSVTASLIDDPGTNIKRIYQNSEAYAIKSQKNANDRPFYKPVAISLIATGYNPTPNKTKIVDAAILLRKTLQQRGCKCSLSFELPVFDKVLSKVKSNTHKDHIPLVFIGLEGSHGDAVDNDILNLIQSLEERGIPFQIFSYKNWSNFSAYSICSSVCLKAGGLPFSVSGSEVIESNTPIIVGLDKSHNRDKKISTFSMVILNNDGVILHRDKWFTQLDETFRDDDTDKVVKILRNFLIEARLEDRSIIVLRDGRMFKNESLETWKNLNKKTNLTYLEIIKNPTPIIYGSNDNLSPLMSLEGSNDGFICPIWDRRNDLGKTRRIRIRMNPNKYTMQQIAELLVVTSYQPRLGPHPTLHPSPIYWADGFAGVSDSQLQFRGFG